MNLVGFLDFTRVAAIGLNHLVEPPSFSAVEIIIYEH